MQMAAGRRGGAGRAVGLVGQIQLMKHMSEDAIAERAVRI